MAPCPYRLLGVSECASENEIRSAYKRQALATHPDKGGSGDAFRHVVSAFEVLVDATRRAAHDAAAARPQPEPKTRERKRKRPPEAPVPVRRARPCAVEADELKELSYDLLRAGRGRAKERLSQLEMPYLAALARFLATELKPRLALPLPRCVGWKTYRP